jgi:hypothetical protein
VGLKSAIVPCALLFSPHLIECRVLVSFISFMLNLSGFEM